jgi:hypothetical protein
MRRPLALALLVLTLAGCASPHPRHVRPLKDQPPSTLAADRAACDDQISETSRSSGAMTFWITAMSLGMLLPVAPIFGPLAASRQRDRYAECLTSKGYEVVWE